MSQENVEIAKRALDAFNQRDLDALRALNDPDVELDWSASNGVEVGVYRGIDAVLRTYVDSFAMWDEIVIEPDRFIDAGDSVVVPNVAYEKGRGGIEVTARSTLVFTVRSRRITRICLYQETAEALKAVGPAE